MSQFDSADLLARFRRYTQTPMASTVFPTDADAYAFITEAAIQTENHLSSLFPKANILAPVLMVTADSGLTYTFGTDSDSNNIFPLGNVEIFPDQASIPDFPLQEYDEYLIEGNKIRMPANNPRTFTSGPYARFYSPTLKIDASTAPLLQPVQARIILVWGGVIKYAVASGNQSQMMELASSELDKEWTALIERYSSEWMQAGSVAMWGRPFGRGRTFGRQNIFGAGNRNFAGFYY